MDSHQPSGPSSRVKQTMAASYRDYVAHMTARNPSLTALSDFLRCKSLVLQESTVSSTEIGVQGPSSQSQRTTCSEIVSKVTSGLTQSLVAIVENLQPNDVETLGTSLDIDPFFFCGHVASSYQAVEDGASSPLMALLPSRMASREYVNIHYQRLLSLDDMSSLDPMTYNLALQATIPRDVRRLPSLSGRAIGLARGCCSVYKKRLSNGKWICLILVDPTTAEIVPLERDTSVHYRRIKRAPWWVKTEDFRDLPTYCAFLASGSTDPDARSLNLREDLLRLIQATAPEWRTQEPSILTLAHYPIKIATAEWMLYTLLMSRYVKFFERSFNGAGSWISEFESTDMTEIYRWRRRGQQSLRKLKMTRLFVEYWGANDPTAISTWTPLMTDLQHLEDQIEQNSRSLEAVSSSILSLVQLFDSHKTIAQAEDVKRLSYIATLFIPLSYVSGVFSMAERYGPGGDRFWVYWVIAVPAVVCVLYISLRAGRVVGLLWALKDVIRRGFSTE